MVIESNLWITSDYSRRGHSGQADLIGKEGQNAELAALPITLPLFTVSALRYSLSKVRQCTASWNSNWGGEDHGQSTSKKGSDEGS
jgi:hypothetical protein